jgi:hypothetical protein
MYFVADKLNFDWSTVLTSGEKARVGRKCYDAPKTDSHTYQRGPIFYLTPVRCLPVLYSTESQNVGSSVGRSERLAYM